MPARPWHPWLRSSPAPTTEQLRPITGRSRHAESGQATILVLAAVAVLAVMVMALGRFGVTLTDSARARTAADAAALAGAVDGRDGAESMARANGASLIEFRDDGPTVYVVVAVDDGAGGGGTAAARAAKPGAPLTTLTTWT